MGFAILDFNLLSDDSFDNQPKKEQELQELSNWDILEHWSQEFGKQIFFIFLNSLDYGNQNQKKELLNKTI